MIKLSNIRSLTDFQRNTTKHLRNGEKDGKPEVLTVNGEAEIVVQSAESVSEPAGRRGSFKNIGVYS